MTIPAWRKLTQSPCKPQFSLFLSASVAETPPLFTSAKQKHLDRVLDEVEKNRFIALPGRGGHSGLVPSELCVPPWRG